MGEAAAQIFAAAGCLAVWRRRRDSYWLVIALTILASAAIGLVEYGPRWVVIAGPITGSVTLTAVVLGFLVWGQTLGFPRPFARALGIGLTSRALRFSNPLIELSNHSYQTMNLAMNEPDRRPRALDDVEAHVRRMRGLHPPDQAWASLRDDVANSYGEWIGLVRREAPTDLVADHIQTLAPLMARWTDMHRQAGVDQRLLATPARRRRASVIWLAAVGFSLLLVGVAQVHGYGLQGRGIADLRLWTMATLVVAGGIFVASSVWVAVRR